MNADDASAIGQRAHDLSSPDETWFYLGHDKDFTLGTERPHLVEWRERGW